MLSRASKRDRTDETLDSAAAGVAGALGCSSCETSWSVRNVAGTSWRTDPAEEPTAEVRAAVCPGVEAELSFVGVAR
jgi:hypothetical protein